MSGSRERYDLQVMTGTIYIVDQNTRGTTMDPKIIAQCTDGNNAVLIVRALNKFTSGGN